MKDKTNLKEKIKTLNCMLYLYNKIEQRNEKIIIKQEKGVYKVHFLEKETEKSFISADLFENYDALCDYVNDALKKYL